MNEHQRIIRALLDSGWTQAKLGAALGKSQSWVVAVLAGEFKDLKWGDGLKLREIAAVRGVLTVREK
jgi:transcriptional regulator with XRE-family HTH domain